MKFRQKEGGYYYGDPVIEIFLPILIVAGVVSMVLLLVVSAVDVEVQDPPLSPDVHETAVVCEQFPAADESGLVGRCTLTIDVADQYDYDNILTTNHVLMLDPGEEYAEVINLIDEPEVEAEGEPEVVETGEGDQDGDGTTLTIEFK